MTAATNPSAFQPFSHSALSSAPLHAAFSNALAEGSALPADLQYMPPGRHRIRASQGGKPTTVEVTVNAQTAATEGREDRPFFDFNHEDREASAWPTEFFWAGDDPKAGGVRVRIDWSDAGRRAVKGRTFRRFSPTFHLDAGGQVTGSEINMGGLQLCDLCVYSARRKEEQKAGLKVKVLDASGIPLVEPLIYRTKESLPDVLAWLTEQQKMVRPRN